MVAQSVGKEGWSRLIQSTILNLENVTLIVVAEGNWMKIATAVGNRTDNQCCRRWQVMCKADYLLYREKVLGKRSLVRKQFQSLPHLRRNYPIEELDIPFTETYTKKELDIIKKAGKMSQVNPSHVVRKENVDSDEEAEAELADTSDSDGAESFHSVESKRDGEEESKPTRRSSRLDDTKKNCSLKEESDVEENDDEVDAVVPVVPVDPLKRQRKTVNNNAGMPTNAHVSWLQKAEVVCMDFVDEKASFEDAETEIRNIRAEASASLAGTCKGLFTKKLNALFRNMDAVREQRERELAEEENNDDSTTVAMGLRPRRKRQLLKYSGGDEDCPLPATTPAASLRLLRVDTAVGRGEPPSWIEVDLNDKLQHFTFLLQALRIDISGVMAAVNKNGQGTQKTAPSAPAAPKRQPPTSLAASTTSDADSTVPRKRRRKADTVSSAVTSSSATAATPNDACVASSEAAGTRRSMDLSSSIHPIPPNVCVLEAFRRLLLIRRKLAEGTAEQPVGSTRASNAAARASRATTDPPFKSTPEYRMLSARFNSLFLWSAFLSTFKPRDTSSLS